MSSTRTAGRRETRPPGARTAPRRSRRTGTATPAPPTEHVEVDFGGRDAAAPEAPPSGRDSRVRSRQRGRVPRHRLLMACTAVLATGLFAVLLLNTVISQGAFRQHELEVQLILKAEEEEALARAVQLDEAPLEVERRARALGMVPAASPVFLRLSDGAVLGEPVPAPEPTGPVDFAGAPGIQPTPTPSPGQPADGIDPAADPATGLDPAVTGAVAATPGTPTAGGAASQMATPALTPAPTPATSAAPTTGTPTTLSPATSPTTTSPTDPGVNP